MSQTKIEKEIINLVFSIRDLRRQLEISSEKSKESQEKLVRWTKVMALAIIGQIIIVITTTILMIFR